MRAAIALLVSGLSLIPAPVPPAAAAEPLVRQQVGPPPASLRYVPQYQLDLQERLRDLDRAGAAGRLDPFERRERLDTRQDLHDVQRAGRPPPPRPPALRGAEPTVPALSGDRRIRIAPHGARGEDRPAAPIPPPRPPEPPSPPSRGTGAPSGG